MNELVTKSTCLLLATLCVACPDSATEQPEPGQQEDVGTPPDTAPPADVCTKRLPPLKIERPIPGAVRLFNAQDGPVTVELNDDRFELPRHGIEQLDLGDGVHEIRASSEKLHGTFTFDVSADLGQTIWLTAADECLSADRQPLAVPNYEGNPTVGTFVVNLADRAMEVTDAVYPGPLQHLEPGGVSEYFGYKVVKPWEIELLIRSADESVPPQQFLHRYERPTVSFLVGSHDDGYRLLHDDGVQTTPRRWTYVTQFATLNHRAFDVCVDETCEQAQLNWSQWSPALPLGGAGIEVFTPLGSRLADVSPTALAPVEPDTFIYIFQTGDDTVFVASNASPRAGPVGDRDDLVRRDANWIMNLTGTPITVQPMDLGPSGDPPLSDGPRTLKRGEQAWIPLARRYVVTAGGTVLRDLDVFRHPGRQLVDLLVFREPLERELQVGWFTWYGVDWIGDRNLDESCDSLRPCTEGLACVEQTCEPICATHDDCSDDELCVPGYTRSYREYCRTGDPLSLKLSPGSDQRQQARGSWVMLSGDTHNVELVDRAKEGRWLLIEPSAPDDRGQRKSFLELPIDHVTEPGEYEVEGTGTQYYSPIGIGYPRTIVGRGTLVVEAMDGGVLTGELSMVTSYY